MTIDDFSWNLEMIYESSSSFYRDLKLCELKVKKIEVPLSDRLNNYDVVYSIFSDIELTYQSLNKLYSYAYLRISKDNSNKENQTIFRDASNCYDNFDAKVSEIHIIMKTAFLNNPGILNELKRKKKFLFYINNMGDSGNNIIYEKYSPMTEYQKLIYSKDTVNKIIVDQDTIVLNYLNQIEYLMDESAEIRKLTYNSFLEQYKNLSIPVFYLYKLLILNYNLKSTNNNYYEDFKNTRLGMYVTDIIANLHLLNPVVDKLISIQRIATNLEEISYSDLYYLKKDTTLSFSIDEAVEIVGHVLTTISFEWGELFKRMITERWIDWLPSPGKRIGGFSLNVYDVHPYVMINWDNTIDSVYALAHESIGAILNYLSRINEFSLSTHSVLMTEIFSQYIEFELTKYFEHYREDTRELLQQREVIDFKDKVITPLINTLFEIENFNDMSSGELSVENVNQNYLDATNKLYGKHNHFYYLEKNKYNWVKQAHIFKPLYDSSYSIVYFIAKYCSNDVISKEKLLQTASLGRSLSDDSILEKILGIDRDKFNHIFKETIYEITQKNNFK